MKRSIIKTVACNKKKRELYEIAYDNWVCIEDTQVSASHSMYLRLGSVKPFKVTVHIPTFNESKLHNCWYSKNFKSHALAKAAFDKIVNELTTKR